MCRYAWHNYRDHFACFACRKAFKYWQWELPDEATFYHRQKLQHVPREIICPDCSEPMVDMGLDFKAPPKSDEDAWKIIHALFNGGFNFASCGCSVGFQPPQTLREVPDWIKQHRGRNDGEKLLEKFAERK